MWCLPFTMLIMVVGVISKYAVARVFCVVAKWN